MSSLLPLIVLSIALLHCTQAAAPKCRVGADVLSSAGVSDGVAAFTLSDADCTGGKMCAFRLHRKLDNPGFYSIHFSCEPPPTDLEHGCKRTHEFLCFCDPVTGSICNAPELMFNPNDDAHKDRIQLASKMGFIVQPPDGAGKITFKMVDLKCEKWTVTFEYTGDVADRIDNVKKSDVNCVTSLCYTKATRNTISKTFKIESDCHTEERTQVVPYEQSEQDNILEVFCLANTENPCNTLKAMFDPNGGPDQKARASALKTKVKLAVQSSTVDGKPLVDFKWSNCIEFHYDQPAEGVKTPHNTNTKTIFCESGVCMSKLARLDRKITVDTGCAEPVTGPAPTETKCKTILEELTTTCHCAADKGPCNTMSLLYNPTSNMKGQKTRLHNLQYIGINATFDSAGEEKFIYEENFGKITTEATITVSGETSVPVVPTARPPSALPEDDPHWRELEGSATGLSLTFTVLFSILRLI